MVAFSIAHVCFFACPFYCLLTFLSPSPSLDVIQIQGPNNIILLDRPFCIAVKDRRLTGHFFCVSLLVKSNRAKLVLFCICKPSRISCSRRLIQPSRAPLLISCLYVLTTPILSCLIKSSLAYSKEALPNWYLLVHDDRPAYFRM